MVHPSLHAPKRVDSYVPTSQDFAHFSDPSVADSIWLTYESEIFLGDLSAEARAILRGCEDADTLDARLFLLLNPPETLGGVAWNPVNNVPLVDEDSGGYRSVARRALEDHPR